METLTKTAESSQSACRVKREQPIKVSDTSPHSESFHVQSILSVADQQDLTMIAIPCVPMGLTLVAS